MGAGSARSTPQRYSRGQGDGRSFRVVPQASFFPMSAADAIDADTKLLRSTTRRDVSMMKLTHGQVRSSQHVAMPQPAPPRAAVIEPEVPFPAANSYRRGTKPSLPSPRQLLRLGR